MQMADLTLIGAAGAVVGATGGMGYAVRGRSSNLFAPSVYHGVRTRRALALTFDDGPSESTPALLELLAEHNVRATFFMCGKNVRRCPAIARQVADAGHEIGNHTDSHPRLDFRGADFIYRELALAQETIHVNTGATPRLFRAPYGVRWFGLRSAQERLHLLGVMWTVIGKDWRLPAARIARLVMGRATNGAIICLHDGRATTRTPDIRATIEAVELAIPALKERGFQFETVSQILCPTN
jgi:peptidoglycan-N-acetylglucosamine deacetylase